MLPGPPPMLKAWPASCGRLLLGQQEGVHQVVDVEDVAHLLAVAVDA